MVDLKGCPPAILKPKLNVEGHLKAIKDKGLGPSDPTQTNNDFWDEKARMWGMLQGDARCRLCCNCAFYVNTTQVKDWIMNTDTRNVKASDLPLTPKWKDIETFPQAYCTLLDITCSPIRTCDFQLMGGPIDDEKFQLPKYKDMLKEDLNEEH
ncbi:hypothetical protein [Flavobacterium sp.]|jgi:hypothetical protein|uniref:hypothetical protein n=1 Tax=Flavobacterium sp. TaxID=239 RepID=UPI0037BF50D8